jgi:hypothetical protein
MSLQKVKSKKTKKEINFLLPSSRSLTKIAGSESDPDPLARPVPKCHGSATLPLRPNNIFFWVKKILVGLRTYKPFSQEIRYGIEENFIFSALVKKKIETEIINSIRISADDLTRAIYCGTLTQADLIWPMIPFRLEKYVSIKTTKIFNNICETPNIYRSCNQALRGDQPSSSKFFKQFISTPGFWKREDEKFDERVRKTGK